MGSVSAPKLERPSVILVRRSAGPIVAGLAAFAAGGALLAGTVGHSPWFAIVGGLLMYVGLLGAVLAGRRFRKRTNGPLAVGSTHVYFRKRPLVALDAIRAAFVVPREERRCAVRVERRATARAFELEFERDEDALAFLHAIGFDTTQTVARFWLASRLAASRLMTALWGSFVATVAMLGGPLARELHDGPLAPLFVLLGVVVVLVPIVWPMRLTIGADGLLVRWITGTEFVPYGAIETVHSYDLGIELIVRSGRRLRLALAEKHPRVADHERRALILERIREAIDAYDRAGGALDPALLVRGGREARAWIRSLRALGSGGSADHRSATVARDELWRVVEDPSAEPAARAGAAIALAPSLSVEERPRLRVAANATASRKVRVVLEAAADGDDDERLERAVEELETGG